MLVYGIIIGVVTVALIFLGCLHKPCEHTWVTEKSVDKFTMYPKWMYYKSSPPQKHYQKCKKCGEGRVLETY